MYELHKRIKERELEEKLEELKKENRCLLEQNSKIIKELYNLKCLYERPKTDVFSALTQGYSHIIKEMIKEELIRKGIANESNE